MSYKKNFLSIIVPTRERPSTLKHCLRTIVSQTYTDIEIIVSDNKSTEETKRTVDGFSDNRIKYIRPEERLGMSEHWEFALSHAQGEWVTFIGDDDGLMPGAVNELFSIINKNKDIKAVQSALCKFIWPSIDEKKTSRLTFSTRKGFEIRKTKPWLKKLLRGDEQFASLPYIYTGGFLHADVIDEIKKKTGGSFFLSITPDVYSAIATSLTLDEYIYSYTPLAVAGLSAHSNGNNMRSWKAEDIKKLHFFSESTIGFHPMLGTGIVKSMPIYIYEAFLRASALHTDAIQTSLADQLALTIVHADSMFKKETYEYCVNLSILNNLDFNDVKRRLLRLKFQRKKARMQKNIKRLLPCYGRQIKVDRDPTLANVYDAACRAASIIG